MISTICVVGLGYVGLPLAAMLSKKYRVVGFDINKKKIEDLKNGIDETGEVEELRQYDISYSSDPSVIADADFIIIAVPTPITDALKPDLKPLESASEIVGSNMKRGAIVVYESTVYPGCTEEVCLPILKEKSGYAYPEEFKIGYSPERINPGDRVHTIDTITKIVSGCDSESLGIIADVYSSFTTVFRATSIKVAEAAKVIENVQRSLNIALMNELALIFDRIGISTREVLEAAGTKWNFHQYSPGLVGGHCIGIDPYYLTYKAQQLGYEPKVILAGQEVNESMAQLVAEKFAGKKNILVLGITFKENVPDARNTKALAVMERLSAAGATLFWHDPVYTAKHQPQRFSAHSYLHELKDAPVTFDGILVFSPHRIFAEYSVSFLRTLSESGAVFFDVKGMYEKSAVEVEGFTYLTL